MGEWSKRVAGGKRGGGGRLLLCPEGREKWEGEKKNGRKSYMMLTLIK